MSSHLDFFVEVRRNGTWGPPEPLAPQGRWDFPKAFTWMHRYGHHWVFFGDNALFPFVRGAPPLPEPSPFCRFIETDWWTAPETSWEEQFRPHWTPYRALCVDLWGEPGSVMVKSRVPRTHAIHFGHGTAEFPRAALLAAGLTEAGLNECWQNANATGQPIDTHADHWPGKPPRQWLDAPAHVTWKTSIRELIGDETTAEFRALAQYAAATDLRVIAMWR